MIDSIENCRQIQKCKQTKFALIVRANQVGHRRTATSSGQTQSNVPSGMLTDEEARVDVSEDVSPGEKNCNHYRSQIIVNGAALLGLAARLLKYVQICHNIDGTSTIFMNRKP